LKIAFKLYIILAISLLISCTIKDFEAPEFDKKIQLPLLNETYYISELADTTDDFIITVENDTMLFSISDNFETERIEMEDLTISGKDDDFSIDLEDDLMIQPEDQTTTIEVGDSLHIPEREDVIENQLNMIEVEESGPAYASVPVLGFASEALDQPVEPINGEIIPPYYDHESFNEDFSVFQNQNYKYVVIDTGTVYIDFFNNTQLPLSSDLGQEYQMYFEFYTNGDAAADNGTYLFTHYIDHVIEPGVTESISLPFDGYTIYLYNYVKCFLTTDGSAAPIDVSEDDSFDVTFIVGNVTVSQLNGIIEAASIDLVKGISIYDDEIQVISAIIESCTGTLTLVNNLPLDIDTLILEFIELNTPENEPYIISVTDLTTYTELVIPLDFEDYTINSSDGNPLDSLTFNIHASTSTTEDYVVIDQFSSVTAEFILSDMYFEQINGIIDQNTSISDSVDVFDESIRIQYAEIDEGTIFLDVNGLNLQGNSSLSILFSEIYDPDTSEPLELIITEFIGFEFDLGGYAIDLSGENHLNFNANMHLDQEITITGSDIVTAEIGFSEIYFSSVTGWFGSLELEGESSVVIDSTGEFKLSYAEVFSNLLQINILPENYDLPFGSEIILTFNDAYNPDGELLIFNFRCPGDTIVDLSGYSLGNDPDSDQIIDSLYFSYTIVTDSSEDDLITLNADDRIFALISVEDIIMQEIRGIIDNKEIELDDIIEDIDLEDLPDSLTGLLEFQAVQLHFSINNQTGFDCDLNMTITGSNDQGNSSEITLNETIQAKAVTDIFLTEGVNELLNIIPDQIEVTNISALIGDGVTIGSLALNDSISGFYEVLTPLTFIINDRTITQDADSFDLDKDDQEIIEENLLSAKMVINIENKLPLGADLAIYFAYDSTQVFTDPRLILDEIRIDPCGIIDGHTAEPAYSQFDISLDQEDLAVFIDPDNQEIFVGLQFQIMGTDGEAVSILATDNINIRGYLEADIHISGSED